MSGALLIGLAALAASLDPAEDGFADPPPVTVDEPAPADVAPDAPDAPYAASEDWPEVAATDDGTDPDFGVRVLGALCGGALGFYVGQYLSPLLLIPVVVVGFIAFLAVGPALLASFPAQLVVALPVIAYIALPVIGLIAPITTAIIVGTLGYNHAPEIVGSVGSRFQSDAPKGRDQAMAY